MLTEDKEKIAEGFKAAGERMNVFESDLIQAKGYIEQIANQIRKLGKAVVSGTLDGNDYNGFWPNEAMAKDFGVVVMRAIGKDMGEGTQTGGSALVPTDLANWIIQKLGKYGKFRKHATKVKLGTSGQMVPRIDSDLTVYMPGEGAEITKSDLTVHTIALLVKKFACLTAVSRELDEDSVVGLGEIVGISITRSMAKKEDLVGFLGDGTSTYFGMTGITGALLGVDETIGNIKSLKVGSGNAYSELTLDDFEGTVAILPDDADGDAKWFCSKKFYYTVMYKLARAAGAADLFAILTDKKQHFFMGFPVEFVSAMPSTEANSQICAVLGDLQLGSYLGERRVLTIAKSNDVYFANDQIGVRGTERIDVNAYGVGDTSEAGPIVGLITAAS